MRLATLVVLMAGCGRFGFSSGFGIDESSIDVSALPCGGTTTQMVALHGGDRAIAFTASVDVPGVTVMPAQGTVAPGADVVLVVTATADPIAIPGTASTGNLLVTTDDPAVGDLAIPIAITTAGGVVTADLSTLDFGQVTNQTARTKTAMVSNAGNTAVSISAGTFAVAGFTVTSAPTFDLAPGASAPIDVEFMPTATQTYDAPLPITVTGPTCAPLPTIDVVGAGTTSTVLLDHTTLDFGPVACGSPSGTMMVGVTNGSSTSYPFTASVTQGAASFSASPTSGTLAGSSMTSITVTRAAVPLPTQPGTVAGNLHVVFTGAPSGTNDLPLRYDISGSVLGSSTTSIDFGRTSTTVQQTVTITNSGNAIADVQVTETGSTRFTAPSSFQIPPNSTQQVTITFHSDDTNTTWTADFTLTAPNQCSNPITIHVSGQGKGGGGN